MFDQLCQTYGDSVTSLGWYSRFTQEQRFWALTTGIEWEGQTLLDVGCGQGDLAGFLQTHQLSAQYTGIDLSPRMIQVAQKKYPEAHFQVGDALDTAFSGQADLVLASGVFNHKVETPAAYFRWVLNRLMQMARQVVAVNVLSDFTPQAQRESDLFTYYSPAEVLSWAMELTPYVELRHHYLPNDLTVILYKK